MPHARVKLQHLIAALALLTAGSLVVADEPRTVHGLTSPESVLVGADGRIYVSEIGGFGKDGDGRIAVIDATGKLMPFATGLDDPKGLAAHKGWLYVADKTGVIKIDRQGRTSVLAQASNFPQPPRLLNDLSADDDGNLFVSDTGDLQGGGKGAIFRITPQGKVTLLVSEAQNPAIKNPNGLLWEGKDRLLVLDFATGELLRLNTKTGATDKLADGFGGGDGLARDKAGVLFISDWTGGRVFKLDLRQPGAKPQPYAQTFQSAADITLSRDERFILVPDMKAGTLVWLPK